LFFIHLFICEYSVWDISPTKLFIFEAGFYKS
jgi:hypothetical protein